MRRATILIPALALVLALGTAVRADEIIKFNNGTYLSIKSHQLLEGMVSVTLGTNASMSFPLSLVSSIEKGGVTLFRPVVKANTLASPKGVTGVVSLNDAPPMQPDTRVYVVPPPPAKKMSNSARRAAMGADDPVQLLYMNGEDGAPDGISMFPGSEDAGHQNFTVVGNKSLGGGFDAPTHPGQTVTIESEPQERTRVTTIQQRMTPLPTHPAEKAALRKSEGDAPPEKAP